MSKRRYTDEQIRMLSHDPNIKEISPNSLRFTLAFRQKIYDAVKENIGKSAIRTFLTNYGYNCHILGNRVLDTLSNNFKHYGRPVNGSRYATSKMYHHDKRDDSILLKTGKFKIG